MGIWKWLTNRNVFKGENVYEDAITRRSEPPPPVEESKPFNCPRCGSKILGFAKVRFTDKSPAPLEEGWFVAGSFSRNQVSTNDDGETITEKLPDMAILVMYESVSEEPAYVCLGLADREEVETYFAPDYPGGKAPDSVQSKPPCGWHGLVSDYRIKWI